jgi:hypothetical protein
MLAYPQQLFIQMYFDDVVPAMLNQTSVLAV